jgi:large subunit ribosomal protein L9
MEVILREDVPSLGQIGDVVRVKPGYARNYLLPRGLAIVADKRNIKRLDHEQRVVGEKRERALRAAQGAAEKIAAVRITVKARAGEEGKLFGSVTSMDLERELNNRGVAVDRKRIRLDEPIKHLGEHKVAVHLGVGVDAEFTVIVEPLEPPKVASDAPPTGEGAPAEPSKDRE